MSRRLGVMHHRPRGVSNNASHLVNQLNEVVVRINGCSFHTAA
jgi:hypothetical protein